MRITGTAEGHFSYTWSFAICPYRVRLSLAIVEALQDELGDDSEPLQGLLLGETGPAVVDLTGWQMVPALDAASFDSCLEGERRNVVGCYLIREGSQFILSPAEVALVRQFFKKAGSVVLLIERRKKGPAEATFFFWRGDVFVHNLPLPFPFDAGILAGESSGVADVPAAAPRSRRGHHRALVIGLYAASAIAVGAMVAAHLRDQRAAAPRAAPVDAVQAYEPPRWIATHPERDLALTWDPRAEPVSNATAGVLKIEDGGATRQMSLDVGELLMGSILYAPASERIRVELNTLQRDGRMLPVTITAQTPPPADSSPVAEVLPPEAPKQTEAPASPASQKEEAPAPVEPARRRPPLKRFTWTTADRLAPESPRFLDAPHEALPSVNPAVLTPGLPPGVVAAPTPPAAPPLRTATAPVPVRTLPRSGRMIWTGTLLRRGVVEVDGHGASVGSVSGALPGAPVNISITPAEFGGDGLVVYVTDAIRHNRVEPPSAANGWNKVTFVWAPDRVREIAVLEAPNPGNAFSRLTVRSDARRCSMLLIDWTLR